MMPRKVLNIIHEIPERWVDFFLLARCFSYQTKALLVLEKEGMSEGSGELSEFTLKADPFPWQGTRTLHQVYNDASKRPGVNLVAGYWNLTSIQRARFNAVGRDG